MNRIAALLVLVSVFGKSTQEESASELEPAKKRNPRVYLISTTTSMSTVSTVTWCYVISSTANGMIACKKKKRALNFLDDDTREAAGIISPASTHRDFEDEEEESNVDVDASKQISDEELEREGKFLNYWMTTTVVSTSYSYTATSSIASVVCTPVGYTEANCPGNGK